MSQDEFFMQRALELATLGIGSVSPNPQVGCVIVHENKIIGEGWHKMFGGPHAEVNAIGAVDDHRLLQHATLYVTLEPCSHTGKTPPCVDLLIAKKIKRVVVAIEDPNPLVAGKGIHRLKQAGIELVVGVLADEATALNKRFFTFIKEHRPYIILKWAQTHDGFIAKKNREASWISNEYSRQLVHKWRTEEDAILIGSETALRDNPQLNVRDWSGRNPLRVVIDSNLKLPRHLHVFDGSQKTIFYNLMEDNQQENISFIKLRKVDFLQHLLNDLYSRGIQSVIVEGGSTTLKSFIESTLWDEARIFHAPISFGDGLAAPTLNGKLILQEKIQGDTLETISEINQTCV